MTDVNTTYTSLKDAINIGLSCIGETPVDAPNNTSTNVVLSKQIIEEVSRDVQSKGWWFNTSGSSISLYANSGSGASEDFNTSLPEEARRYISIRAARVLQSRFVGSEELLKFSFQEEQVSLAILTQAHVRNGGGSTSFNSFPAELKALGIEEVLFLQQSAEEKLLSLRLKTELKQAEKLASEKDLVDAQKSQVQTETVLRSQQALTELEETSKRTREAELIDAQEALIQKQILTEAEQVAKVQEEVDLLETQDTLVTNQAATEVQNALKVAAETSLLGEQEDLVEAQALDVAADTALKGNQSALVASQKTQLDAQTAIEATAEKAFYDGVVAGTQDTYRDYAAEMRIMGVQESTFQQTPAYKKVELIKDATKLRTATATETGTDATELSEVNKIMRFIGEPPVAALNDNSLASETVRLLRDTDTELQGRGWYFNIDEDDAIVPKSLVDTPQKYREYLSVRVAILLTELYPQSGVDIQRLPKMEAELRAYFKDREFDDANYSIFDSYDVASRIGINRNYDLS